MRYFRRHHAALFPKLKQVHRTTFVRQAAKLWALKYSLHRRLLQRIQRDPTFWIIDSFPMPVCRFARAYRCRILREAAAWGYDEMTKQTFYGLRGHLRIAWPGVIVASQLAPANAHDVTVAPEITAQALGQGLGDRNYHSPRLAYEFEQQGLELATPPKKHSAEDTGWSRHMTQRRRRIETVIGQLVERYHAKRVWARDRWHLTSRWLRKLCSHTIAVLLCQEQGLPPLQFAKLITE